MRKWIAIGVGGVAALVLFVVGVGLLLPRNHVAASSLELAVSRDSVWTLIRDFGSYPTWWPDAAAMDRLPDRSGHEVWGQRDKYGEVVPLEIVEVTAPERLVARIAGESLPFGGTWTYELTGTESGGVTLTITERGEITNPVFRTMARFVFGYHATLDSYLESVARRFGSTAAPRHVG
jgi:uncharacterized protein YndB with AHSA1/START domain